MFIRVFRFSSLLGNLGGAGMRETALKSLFPEMSAEVKASCGWV